MDEYVNIMNNLNLPNPKMMDIAVPGNLSLGISLEKQKLSNGLEKKDFFVPKEKRLSMILNINKLIYRLEPNDKELRILASIISSLSKN